MSTSDVKVQGYDRSNLVYYCIIAIHLTSVIFDTHPVDMIHFRGPTPTLINIADQ